MPPLRTGPDDFFGDDAHTDRELSLIEPDSIDCRVISYGKLIYLHGNLTVSSKRIMRRVNKNTPRRVTGLYRYGRDEKAFFSSRLQLLAIQRPLRIRRRPLILVILRNTHRCWQSRPQTA